ncbi:MAG TPA: hypothetical protein VK137_03470, partial [Planctomycetaceae bacterium]|nr:hypothetical protein [Planctomycetaceae bacterium]
MLNPVYCSGCGLRLAIPPGHAKSKLRCAECGVFNEIPKEVLEALAAVAASSPAKPQAAAEPEPEPSEERYGFLKEPEPAAPPVGEKPAEPPKPKPKKKKPVSD